MDAQRPSPLAFPGTVAFDSTLSDTDAAARFALTQDLLREAGAASMLDKVLDSMPASREPAARATPLAGGTPGAGSTAILPTAARVMQMASAPGMTGTDLGTGDSPVDSARCARSLRIVSSPGWGRVAVWWSRRDRGRVFLLAAWQLVADSSGDGPHGWRGPIAVDTLDQGAGDANAFERGALGCNRAAPGLAVDERKGYVHVAYALNAPEGPGVFYAHQTDPRSAFESPVVMMYGDRRMGAARVATAGDLVAVVFEDPNAPLNQGRIGLAISNTSGLTFEPRVNASRSGHAIDPYIAVRGRAAVVGWTDVDSTVRATAAFRMRRGILR